MQYKKCVRVLCTVLHSQIRSFFSLSANLVLYSTLKWISAGLFSVQKKKAALVINSAVCIPFANVDFCQRMCKSKEKKKPCSLFCLMHKNLPCVFPEKSQSPSYNVTQGGGSGLLKKMFTYHHLGLPSRVVKCVFIGHTAK